MNAAFTIAARYRVRATCVTPLRTGDANGDPESVLWDSNGHALLQGSSIAGALRSWLTENGESEKIIFGLFGSSPNPAGDTREKRPGRLIISDGKFSDGIQSVTRPRLRINGKTGSAADKAKFDMAHIPSGSAFEFTLTWLGKESCQEELDTVKKLLTALHCGAISLGAQKTNGFGQVCLKVWKRVYHMSKRDERDAWLEDKEDKNGGENLELSKMGLTPGNHVIFRLKAQADSMIVKSSIETEKESDENEEQSRSYAVCLRENGKPVLPGSSIKGAVRAHAERIACYLNLNRSLTRDLFGSSPDEKQDKKQAEDHMPGRVIFQDAILNGAPDQTITRKITRIRINRFTAGVIRGGLFSEEAASGTVELLVRVPADRGAGCALILYALRDFALGLYNLGGDGAIGRGYLTKSSLTAKTPDGKEIKLTFDDGDVRSVSDADGLWKIWRQALEAYK